MTDPVTLDAPTKLMLKRMFKRILSEQLLAEAEFHIPDADRALGQVLKDCRVDDLMAGCTSPAELHRLFWRASYIRCDLVARQGRTRNKTREELEVMFADRRKLDLLCALMFSLGAVRGIQLGRNLDTKAQGITNAILKHKAVRRLLLSKGTTVQVCRTLDKVMGLPWPKLRKQYGTWEDCAAVPVVKMAISNARKAALQEERFNTLLSVAKGAGDGSLLQ